jgi:uncharacterized protein
MSGAPQERKQMRKELIFFLHSGGPQGPHEGSGDFVSWLRDTLGSEYNVIHPGMPNPEAPEYAPWKAKLGKELGQLKDGVIFVGHSLGGAVLLKYLAEEPFENPIAGMFLVSAPFWGGDENWQYEPEGRNRAVCPPGALFRPAAPSDGSQARRG